MVGKVTSVQRQSGSRSLRSARLRRLGPDGPPGRRLPRKGRRQAVSGCFGRQPSHIGSVAGRLRGRGVDFGSQPLHPRPDRRRTRSVRSVGAQSFRAYLWDLRSGRLKLVASSLGWIEKSPNSLAYLNVVSDAVSTLSLAADGSTTPVALPRAASISPDGTHYIWTSDPTSAGVVMIELRVTATGRVLDSLVGTNPAVVWNGNAALVSESGLVVLDRTTVTKMPLP